MLVKHIHQKLEDLGVSHDSVIMGDFDYIGEYTAKRRRDPSEENYKKYGAFFRSNYERGILIYYLIRSLNMTSFLEVGFGRGYATFCAAKAFHDSGINGKIVTIDPKFDKEHLNNLQQVFPQDWFKMIKFVQGSSSEALPQLTETFDLVYIDGDHSYHGTKSDWEKSKDKTAKAILFDDYHFSTKNDPGIQCSQAINEIDFASAGFEPPECIRLDRRMFFDDRRFSDEQVDYGQVLAIRQGITLNEW